MGNRKFDKLFEIIVQIKTSYKKVEKFSTIMIWAITRDKFVASIVIGYILVTCDVIVMVHRSIYNDTTEIKDQVVRKETLENHLAQNPKREYKLQQQLFDCANIHIIDLGKKLGEGVTKEVYLGTYGSWEFAVKMATIDVKEVSECILSQKLHGLEHYLNSLVCYDYTARKMLAEIFLFHEIHHPGLAELVGFCFRSHEVKSSVLTEHGVISVFEVGKVVTEQRLRNLTWQERMKHAYELADLIQFADHSPIGPLYFADMKLTHFIEVNSMFKLIDLDGVINYEPKCDVTDPCQYDLPCVDNTCRGTNAKLNMELLRDEMLIPLFVGASLPAEIKPGIDKLLVSLNELDIDAAGLKLVINNLFDLVVSPST